MLALKPALQQSEGRSKPWSGASLVNAFAEMAEGDKYAQFAVMAIPGLLPFSDVAISVPVEMEDGSPLELEDGSPLMTEGTNGALPVRGVHRMRDVLYAVVGATLFSIAEDGSETALGTIPGNAPVRIADNGSQLAIHGGVNQDTGYIYSDGAVHTAIPNLPQVSDVTYIDGYFVWDIYQSDQFIISAINDGLVYDPLDVATVEGAPDFLVGLINDHRELHFYGQDTVEIWYNSGDADFPFARQGNAFIERGLRDKNSLVKIDNSVHFVGDDLIVYRLNGYDPQRISTHAIEYRIADATYFTAFTYTQLGHKFYVLNTDVGCFAYDMATGAWAERKSFGLVNYRVSCACTCYGRTIMGDGYSSKLYIPDLDVFDEDGAPIPVEISLPTLDQNRELSTLYAFEIYFESGVGNAEEPDPQIILQYSKDGGRTFGTEIWRAMGRVGEYQKRAIWRLGVQFRQLQIRLKLPGKVKRFSISYNADWE